MVGVAWYIGEGCKWTSAILKPHMRIVMKDTVLVSKALSNLWVDKLYERKDVRNKIYIWTSEKLRGLMVEEIWNKQKEMKAKKFENEYG